MAEIYGIPLDPLREQERIEAAQLDRQDMHNLEAKILGEPVPQPPGASLQHVNLDDPTQAAAYMQSLNEERDE